MVFIVDRIDIWGCFQNVDLIGNGTDRGVRFWERDRWLAGFNEIRGLTTRR